MEFSLFNLQKVLQLKISQYYYKLVFFSFFIVVEVLEIEISQYHYINLCFFQFLYTILSLFLHCVETDLEFQIATGNCNHHH